MQITGVDALLREDKDAERRLRVQPLLALEPRREPYFALLCQPHGTIHASTARIGNSDSAAVHAMYRALLDRAVEHQAQLVVSPEYSVPWSVLNDVIAGQVRPPKGALWACGFESITPDALDVISAQVAAKSDLRVIHEPFDPMQRAQKAFVDPLVYMFWSWDSADRDVLCILIQFKTVVSRDADHVELTSLYLGKHVYKFNEGSDHISLIGLICSDAFEFTNELVDVHHANLLILHIQLNQRPGHEDYATYRLRLYSVASSRNVEVVCLNWAARLAVEGNVRPWNSIAGSAWYVAPRGVEIDDKTVDDLHAAGAYYSLVGHHWHAFYLNYRPHCLLLRKQRVFATGPGALIQRIAPEVVERTSWRSEQTAWVNEPPDDGFGAFINDYQPLDTMLPPLCGESPLAVERSLELLTGPSGNALTWYTLAELESLKVGEEESLRQVTVSQESDPLRAGVAFRRAKARSAQAGATLNALAPQWPPAVADLAGGFSFCWVRAHPHCNVRPIAGGGEPATLVYLGENPESDVLANVHAKLVRALRTEAVAKSTAGGKPADAELNQATDRLCIAYKQGHLLEFYRPPSDISITDPRNTIADDIAGESS